MKTVTVDGIVSWFVQTFGTVGGGIIAFFICIVLLLYQRHRKQFPVWFAYFRRTAAPVLRQLPSRSLLYSAIVQPAVPQESKMTFDVTKLDPTTIPGAGRAMLNPPSGVEAALAYMNTDHMKHYGTPGSYKVPLGWYVGFDNVVRLAWGILAGHANFNHMLVTGHNDSGKDNFLRWMALSLMLQHPPEEVEFWIIDPKGLDWSFFEGKAHVKLLQMGSRNPFELVEAMRKISDERVRRGEYIRTFKSIGATEWDDIPIDKRPPLMVVIVTELINLRGAVRAAKALKDDRYKKRSIPVVDVWLAEELSQIRAFGGRCLIGTQLVNNYGTDWRGQFDAFIGGHQVRDIYDEPNMNFPAAKIIALGDAVDKNGIPTGTGAVPPSQIPPSAEINGKAVETQGVMTLVCLPGQAITVRGSYITKPQLAAYAAKLPDRPANAAPRDEYEEEPLQNTSAERKYMRQLDSDAIKVETELVELRKEFPGPEMSYNDIVAYFTTRRTEEPSVSQAKIEAELFGYSGGAAYSTVSRALKVASMVISRRPVGATTTTTTTTAEESATTTPATGATTTENDQNTPESAIVIQ